MTVVVGDELQGRNGAAVELTMSGRLRRKTTGGKTRRREREGTTKVMGESEKMRNRLRPIKVPVGAYGLRSSGSDADEKNRQECSHITIGYKIL